MGFLVKTEDAGKHWQDYTPNVLASASAPTGSADPFIFKQVHDDIHNDGTFYMLCERYDSSAGKWQGWVLKTTDNWITCAWHLIPGAASNDCGFLCAAGPPPCFRTFNCAAGCGSGDLTPGQWHTLSSTADDGAGKERIEVEMDARRLVSTRNAIGMAPGGVDYYRAFQCIGGGYVLTKTTNDTTQTDEPLELLSLVSAAGSPFTIEMYIGDYDTTVTEARPLAMDLDSENSSRLYVTAWDNINIVLYPYVTANLAVTPAPTVLGAATDQQVADKTYFVVPRSPHLPGVVGFGDWCYLFGRWDDGTLRHLMLSTDGGNNFTDLGDGQWTGTAYRMGGLSVVGAGDLYAFMNAASPRLWHTGNTGSAWTNLNYLPFSVEHGAVSRHSAGDGEFLIGSNAAGSVQAAWQASPYTGVWIDATGILGQRLPTAADGGSNIASIFWLGIPLT